MSLEDIIRDREERNRPAHLWRDVVVMARELNSAMRLARKKGLEILVTVHNGQVFVNYLNEVEETDDSVSD
jgi:hypothetical protein